MAGVLAVCLLAALSVVQAAPQVASVIGWTSTTSIPQPAPAISEWSTAGTANDAISVWPSHGLASAFPFSAITSGARPSSAPATSAPTSSSKVPPGAIIGAVMGAVVVVVLAGLLLLRYRNKRSAEHWRNRNTTRWLDLEKKQAKDAQAYDQKDLPFDGSNRAYLPDVKQKRSLEDMMPKALMT